MLLLLLLVVVGTSSVHSFPVPSRGGRHSNNHNCPSTTTTSLAATQPPPPPSSEEVRARLRDRLRQLRAQDRQGRTVAVDDLQIVFEDDHLLVVDKPAGVLCLPSSTNTALISAEDVNDDDDVVDASVPPPSLAQTVFDYCQQKWKRQQQQQTTADADESIDDNTDDDRVRTMQQMVVHRLGFDTSGLIILGKTLTAVRGLHSLFRTRNITRQYEVLVAGHMIHNSGGSSSSSAVEPGKAPTKDEKQQLPQDSKEGDDHDASSTKHASTAPPATATTGLINLPLMRCYEHPPYMRVSTDEHQRNLMHLDASIVGKKLLEAPKASLTHYQVINGSEYWRNDPELPVTRLTLTSLTGRTHQLNVHCAAVGRPIVGDAVYGYGGRAAPRGGLVVVAECGSSNDGGDGGGRGAPEALQRRLAAAADRMCVHAKLVRFRHPVTGEDVECTSPPPF